MRRGIDRLRRVAIGEADADDLAWLSGRLRDYLSRPQQGLDSALLIDKGWWRRDRLHQRDALILRLWRERYGNLSPWEAAAAIGILASRYQASAWPRHRDAETRPADAALALVHDALALDVGFPASQRQIHRILETTERDVLY